MAGAHDTEKKAFTMLLFAYITALEEEEDEQHLIQQRDQVARIYRRAVVRHDRSQKTTVWSFFEPPRHPVEDGGPSSIPKLHQNNTTAL